MRKFYVFFCACIASLTIANAQQANGYYFHMQQNVMLADMSTGATQIFGVNVDEESSLVYSIPFSFQFNNVVYSNFSVNSNGYLGLGTTQVFNSYFNEIRYAPAYPVIIPWWEDLYTATNGSVKYKVVGATGRRKLVIEWKVNTYSDALPNFNKTFQVWLHEGSNLVQFVYGAGFADWYNASSIGIAGGSSNFISVHSGLQTASIATAKDNNRIWPGTGRSYIFSQTQTLPTPQAEPIVVSSNILRVNISCFGLSNGAINLGNISGGEGALNVSWTGPNGYTATGSAISGLANGTYTYSVTDASMTSTASGSIVITAPAAPVGVSIAASSQPFCANLGLLATATETASYVWSNEATTQNINLTATNTDGNYTVTATNAAGCSATASYNYVKQNLLSSYTVIGLKNVSLGENNTVNGAVGNTAVGLKVSVNRFSQINGFVMASVINVNSAASVSGNQVLAPVSVSLPDMFINTSNTLGLTNLNIPDDYNGPTITGNYKDVIVGRRATATFTGSVFGKFTIKEGADVVFSSSDVNIEELKTENGKAASTFTDFTTVTFSANSRIIVKNKVSIGDRNMVMGNGATFFMGDDNKDDEKISISGKNTTVTANVLMLRGKMSVKGADANNTCTMNGMFIAEEISSDKYVTWNGNNCNAPASRSYVSKEIGNVLPAFVVAEQKLNVFPNPSNGVFSLKLDKTISANAEVVIYDQKGVEVMRRKVGMSEGGQMLSFDIGRFASGLYMVTLKNGNSVQSTKILIRH